MKYITFLIVIFSQNTFSQNVKEIGITDSIQPVFSSKGIFVESLNTLIPWYVEFSEINRFGNPSITTIDKHLIVRWDSIELVKGIKLNLYYWPQKILFKKGTYARMNHITGSADSINIKKLINFCYKTFGEPAEIKFYKSTKMTDLRWRINGCQVNISQWANLPESNRILIGRIPDEFLH